MDKELESAEMLYNEHRENVWTCAMPGISDISKHAAWPDWDHLPEPLKMAWRTTSNTVVTWYY